MSNRETRFLADLLSMTALASFITMFLFLIIGWIKTGNPNHYFVATPLQVTCFLVVISSLTTTLMLYRPKDW